MWCCMKQCEVLSFHYRQRGDPKTSLFAPPLRTHVLQVWFHFMKNEETAKMKEGEKKIMPCKSITGWDRNPTSIGVFLCDPQSCSLTEA